MPKISKISKLIPKISTVIKPHAKKSDKHKNNKLLFLTLGALGVVFGDIGTSPLYAVNQIFFGSAQVNPTLPNILGAISLIVWALTIVVCFKYVIFVLRADNGGEGGVFALYGILDEVREKLGKKSLLILLFVLMLAAGLLFGDGIITPAISVLSAVEGLAVATSTLQPYIVPITIILLTLLFFFQSYGTAKVGNIFGPIIVVWFMVIAALGLRQVLANPAILWALNPIEGLRFLTTVSFKEILIIMGFVMLAITGGEALYADMGHFGKKPIRLGWFSLVYPALLLNYLGQGAFLLSGQTVADGNIFYSLVPHVLIFPMIILATAATIIASQALISGAFSLTSQASAMKLLPHIRKIHTSNHQEGQIYVPIVNWSLLIGCVMLVLYFRSSSNLASAYGLSVSADMLINSLAMAFVALYVWQWKPWRAFGLFVPLAIVDSFFFVSNSIKFFEGGYIPVAVGVSIYFLMNTWRWGRRIIDSAYDAVPKMNVEELVKLSGKPSPVLKKTVIFMCRRFVQNPEENVPIVFQVYWERFKVLPQNIIFLHVKIEKKPKMQHRRFDIVTFKDHEGTGNIVSVCVNFGYREKPNVEDILDELADHDLIHIADDHKEWMLYIIKERLHANLPTLSFCKRIRIKAFQILLRNSDSADDYFGLGHDIALSAETLPVNVQ